MSRPLKLILVAGARPNFMKVAPIIRAIHSWNTAEPPRKPGLDYILVHTGQHYDYEMSAVFFEEFGLPEPHIHLGVGSGSHGEQPAKKVPGGRQCRGNCGRYLANDNDGGRLRELSL